MCETHWHVWHANLQLCGESLVDIYLLHDSPCLNSQSLYFDPTIQRAAVQSLSTTALLHCTLVLKSWQFSFYKQFCISFPSSTLSMAYCLRLVHVCVQFSCNTGTNLVKAVLFQFLYQTFSLVIVRFCFLYSDLVIVIFVLLWKLLVIVQLSKMEMAKLKGFQFQLTKKKRSKFTISILVLVVRVSEVYIYSQGQGLGFRSGLGSGLRLWSVRFRREGRLG